MQKTHKTFLLGFSLLMEATSAILILSSVNSIAQCGNVRNCTSTFRIQVHARTRYLSALKALEVPMMEKMERKVIIKEISSKIFERVVKYIKDGSFDFDVKTEASESLEVSDRLDMEKLKEELCNNIKENLDPENAKAVATLAWRFNANQLFQSALEFMTKVNHK